MLFELHEVRYGQHDNLLWAMLQERDIETTSISHRRMPSWEEHCRFVKYHTYKDWYLVCLEDSTVFGQVYLTQHNEIGIQIFKIHQRRGIAEWAVREMMKRHPEVPKFFANINPRNAASQAFFQKLHFNVVQMTWCYDGSLISSPGTGVHPPNHNDEDPETRPG